MSGEFYSPYQYQKLDFPPKTLFVQSLIFMYSIFNGSRVFGFLFEAVTILADQSKGRRPNPRI